MFTYGVFFKEFQAEFGWSRAAISGASSLAFLTMGLVGVIAGKLNDRIGPKVIIVASGISLGIGYLLMSRLQALWQLYLIYGVLVGIGFSTHDVITLSTVARWFIRRRGMMSGIVKVGTGSGQFMVPLIATLLIADYGWRNSYLIIGAAALLIYVVVAQVLNRDPQDIGLLPDGDSNESYDDGNRSREESVTLKALEKPAEALEAANEPAVAEAEAEAPLTGWKKVSRIARNIGLFLAAPFIALGYVIALPAVGFYMFAKLGYEAYQKKRGSN